MVSDFESIYQQYGKTVYFFLLSLTQNESLSEELTQETMCRAIMNIGAFRGESRMSVWLCQIAKNLYFEWQKKNKRNVPIEDALLAEPDGLDTEEELTRKETAHRILKHLHTLDDPYKEIFMLHALGDVPLKQISQLFGKSDSCSSASRPHICPASSPTNTMCPSKTATSALTPAARALSLRRLVIRSPATIPASPSPTM